MKRTLAGLFVLAIVLSGCAQAQTDTADSIGYVAADGSLVLRDPDKRGKPIDITGKLLNGATWQLSTLRGTVVLLNAWGPWCAPCRTEVPLLQDLQDSLPGIQVVGFATRTDNVAVEAFTSSRKITYPQVQDFDSRLFLGIGGVPSISIPGTLVIDKQGRVAGWALGATDTNVLGDFAKSLLEEQ